MSSEGVNVQEALFPLSDQADGAVTVVSAQAESSAGMAPLGAHWTEVDGRELRRHETLTETGGWSAERARAATGVGEVAMPEAVVTDAGMQHRDWTPDGRREHLAGAERVRLYLEGLGLPRTRSARERPGR